MEVKTANKNKSTNVDKNNKKRRGRWLKYVIVVVLALIVALLIGSCVYLSTWQKCTDSEAMSNTQYTRVYDESDCILLDGPGQETCLVFYPGAKCDSASYNAMLKQVSDEGIDVIVAKPPFHMQIFAVDQASEFMSRYNYHNWLIGGHSMGGAMASQFCSNNPGAIAGLVLIAAYSTNDLHGVVSKCLSVRAEFDNVLNAQSYNKYLDNLPQDTKEVMIFGGNHAGFGNYGDQLNDGQATISAQQQQMLTAKSIVEFAK